VDLLWEHSDDYFQGFEEKLSYLRNSDLAMAVVPGLEEGPNCLFDGFNRSARNSSNPVRSCL